MAAFFVVAVIALVPLTPVQRPTSRTCVSGPRLSALNLLSDPEQRPPPEKVVAAVEATYQRQPEGTRITAADLAAQSGLGIDDARMGMKELATALAGAEGLSVSASDKGDLLYAFPSDVRGELASRNNAAKARDAWNSAKPVVQTVGRFSFGLALFASIAIIFTAITVLTQGGSDERDDRRDNRGGGMMGGGFGGGFGWGYGWSPLDLFFPRPFGFYGYGWFAPPPRMSLPEAIFSFVFGDGDPNGQLRAARVRALAEVIRANGGAVVAETLAPYLDAPPPATALGTDSSLVDESWLLPAVSELGGRPEVRDDGSIVYVFDELAISAIASDANLVLADPALAAVGDLSAAELAELATERAIATRGADTASLRDALRSWAGSQLGVDDDDSLFLAQGYLEERTAPFSNAEGGQQFAAGFLGLVNLGGAAYLGSLLAQIPPGVRLPDELGLLQAGFPFLLAYAIAYVAIPAVRFVNLQASNAQIEQRNADRRAWRDALRAPGQALRKKLDAAKSSKRALRVVGEDDVSFDSAKSITEQRDLNDPGLDDFDKRLREKTGGQ